MSREHAPGDPRYLLAALAVLNVLSYTDRQMIAALAPLLIAELGLSRAEIGLLIGVAFMAVFATATLAMGLAADRVRRPRLLALGLAVWSTATAGSGSAGGFASLAVWRSWVGIGEATLSPTALAMLADRFPAARRGFANGVFYAGIPVGFALSYAIAGWVGPWLGWRACFVLLGALGLGAVAIAWRLPDAEGPRSGAEAGTPLDAKRLWRAFASQPALLVLMLAGALLAYTSASSQHTITWLVEERGFLYARAAWTSALVTAGAGLAGNLAIGALTDRARRSGAGARLLCFAVIGAGALGAAAGFYLLPPASPLFLGAWLLAQAWLLGWYGPLFAAILDLAPPGLRATSAGVALLVINLIGVATGPWLTGVIGDRSGLTVGLTASLAFGWLGLLLAAAVGWRLRRHASG